jgi:hypothetical protein
MSTSQIKRLAAPVFVVALAIVGPALAGPQPGVTSGGGFTTGAYGAPPPISLAPPTSGIVNQPAS